MASISSWMKSGDWFNSKNYIPTSPNPPLSSKARASYDTWGKEQFRTLWEGRAAEQDRLLAEIEDEIRAVEAMIQSGRGGAVERLRFEELVKERDKILNPMKYRSRVVGATKVTTPAEKQARAVERELKKQQKITELETKIQSEQERLGPLAARKETKEYERLTGIKVTDPKVIKTLQDFRKKEADIANAEARGSQREAKAKAAEEINKLIEAEEDPMVKAEYKGLLPQINAGMLTPSAAMGLADAIAEKSARELLAKQTYQTGEREARQEFATGEREARQTFTREERISRAKDAEDLRVDIVNFQNESRAWGMQERSRADNVKRLQVLINQAEQYILQNESLAKSTNPEDQATAERNLNVLRPRLKDLQGELNKIPASARAPVLNRSPASGMTQDEQEAYDWAVSNPNDPRSAQILRALGM